jgi:hypothetical protein
MRHRRIPVIEQSSRLTTVQAIASVRSMNAASTSAIARKVDFGNLDGRPLDLPTGDLSLKRS